MVVVAILAHFTSYILCDQLLIILKYEEYVLLAVLVTLHLCPVEKKFFDIVPHTLWFWRGHSSMAVGHKTLRVE